MAAGYALYGPATMLVLSVGNGVHGFTLDPILGDFRLTHPQMRIPPEAQEFAINSSNSRFWETPVKRYVNECLAGTTGPRGKDFNMRWLASLVLTHRLLLRGVSSARHEGPGRPHAPLYEVNSLAFGGAGRRASTAAISGVRLTRSTSASAAVARSRSASAPPRRAVHASRRPAFERGLPVTDREDTASRPGGRPMSERHPHSITASRRTTSVTALENIFRRDCGRRPSSRGQLPPIRPRGENKAAEAEAGQRAPYFGPENNPAEPGLFRTTPSRHRQEPQYRTTPRPRPSSRSRAPRLEPPKSELISTRACTAA
jgi:hypothetical protein